jgi:hypothetical protein
MKSFLDTIRNDRYYICVLRRQSLPPLNASIKRLPDSVNSPFNASRKACTKVHVPTCRRGLMPNNLNKAFGKKPPKNGTDAYRSNSWALIQSYQSSGHQGTVCCPGWVAIGKPFAPGCHLLAESL